MHPLIANQQTAVADFAISPWAQFGLGGAVIGALFGTLLFFIRQHYTERDKRELSASKERDEWRADIKEIAAKHDATTKEMTDKFIHLHEKTLDAVRRDGQ